MIRTRILIPALVLATAAAAQAQVQFKEKRVLTLEGARVAIAAVAVEATRQGVGGAVAVVDDGGHVLSVDRLEGTFAAGVEVAIAKARTAATFQRPTKAFEDAVKNGRTALVAVDALTPLQGGVPIVVDGEVVGAIGVSGAASADQDQEFALAGAMAAAKVAPAMVSPSSGEVTYLDGARVRDGFRKGAVLVDHGAYMVHASHREQAGQAEVHTEDTDIIYVLDGTAVFVTGGAVAEPSTIGPGEIRGISIEGGDVRHLQPGDVVVVPHGTPHWFREVPGPFDYYVVKVRRAKGGLS